MAEYSELKASVRERVGKGAARAVRRNGGVPGVVYGNKQAPESVILDYKTILQQYESGHLLATVYMLDIDGKKTRVIPRDIQLEPVRDFVLHVDFLRLARDATVTVEIPVEFVGEDDSPGLKRGGVLNVVRYAIELVCPADAIPDTIEADLKGLDIGDSVHISSVKLPANVEPTITDRDFTIATIAGQVSEEEAEAEEGEELAPDEVPATAQKEEEEGEAGEES